MDLRGPLHFSISLFSFSLFSPFLYFPRHLLWTQKFEVIKCFFLFFLLLFMMAIGRERIFRFSSRLLVWQIEEKKNNRKHLSLNICLSFSLKHSFTNSVLPALFLFCLWLFFFSLFFYLSPGEQQIGHLITHDPLGNTMAGNQGVGGIKQGL